VLVPKLQLGNSVWEALASRLSKLEFGNQRNGTQMTLMLMIDTEYS